MLISRLRRCATTRSGHAVVWAAQPLVRTGWPRSLLTRPTTHLPRIGDWHSLPASERAAWEMLGWTAESWSGSRPAPVTALQSWRELSPAQQAAAQHGLGWQSSEWDSHLHSDAHDLVVSPPPPPASRGDAHPPAGNGIGSLAVGVARAGWAAAKLVAPLAGQALQSSGHPLAAILGHAMGAAPLVAEAAGGKVPVVGVETCVYLDDSGSMAQSQVSAGGWGSGVGNVLMWCVWWGERRTLIPEPSSSTSPPPHGHPRPHPLPRAGWAELPCTKAAPPSPPCGP